MAGPVPGAEDVEVKDKVSALASFQSKGEDRQEQNTVEQLQGHTGQRRE